MPEITDAQQIRLNLLSTLNYDTAAAKVAVEFVQDDPLKYQLFIQQYSRVTSETEVVAKTMKAVQEATEALPLFDLAAKQGLPDVNVQASFLFRKVETLERMNKKDEAKSVLATVAKDKLGANNKKTLESMLKRLGS